MNDEQSNRLIEWWFSGTQKQRYHRWFGKNPDVDKFVMDEWGPILHALEHILRKKVHCELILLNKKQLFGTILLFDQLSR